jgi:hypothetical protein
MVGLSPVDAATLQHDGVLALPAPFDATTPRAARVDLTIDGTQPHQLTATVARGNLRAVAGIDFLITTAKAHELGLVPVDAGAIATNPSAFDESQRASIEALSTSVALDQGASPSSTAILWSGNNSKDVSANVVKQIILGIVIFIALIVLATSLALSAAETRDERDVLVALGARPGTMRGLAAWKAGLLSFTGAAVAVPTGFIPVALVYLAAVRPDERARLGVPWMTIAELVLAAPLIAAFVAAIGSSVAQRIRPTQMSTFATD